MVLLDGTTYRNAIWNTLFAFLLNYSIALTAGQDCQQTEFTKCAESLEMLHLTAQFSIDTESSEGLEKLCRELRVGIQCVQDFTRRCMEGHKRAQFNKLYRSTGQFIRDLCNKGDFQDEYLKQRNCFALASIDFELCSKEYKQRMVFLEAHNQQSLSDNSTIDANIRTICCSVNDFVDCSEGAARRVCGHDGAEYTRQLLNQYSSSLKELYCEEFTEHPERCVTSDAKELFLRREVMSLMSTVFLLLLVQVLS